MSKLLHYQQNYPICLNKIWLCASWLAPKINILLLKDNSGVGDESATTTITNMWAMILEFQESFVVYRLQIFNFLSMIFFFYERLCFNQIKIYFFNKDLILLFSILRCNARVFGQLLKNEQNPATVFIRTPFSLFPSSFQPS